MQDITIRNASLADAPRILEIYAWYVEHTVITFEYDVPSLEEFEGRMRRTMQKYPYLVIERDGRVEGYAYAGSFVGRAAYDWACELTIYLDHDARKHGMGRALYEALADRLQAMGILNLYACIGYPQVEDLLSKEEMLSFVWNNSTKTEERSREFLLLSIVGLSSNLKLLVAMRLGVTPVPIPNTMVKT